MNWAEHPDLADRPDIKIDKRGVPVTRYTTGWYRNAGTAGTYALWHWSLWLRTGDRTHLEAAKSIARWLLRRQSADGAWRNQFAYYWPAGEVWMRRGWTDALAQGLAISLFVRLAKETRHPVFLRRAKLALRPFKRSIFEGGVTQDYEGQKFFDHCVCPGGFVLNAHLLATLGLYDLSNRSRYARRLYRTGIRTAQRMLPLYDHDPVAYDLTHLTVRKGEEVNATQQYEDIILAALQALDSTKPRFVYWRSRWAAD